MIIYPFQMEMLKAHPYFSHIDEKDMKWFLTCMDAEFADAFAGEVLCRQGEEMEFVPVVLSGTTDNAIPPFSSWKAIESQSGLSHSTIALTAPADVKAASDCKLIRLRVMRLLKPCNFHCPFHVGVTEKI